MKPVQKAKLINMGARLGSATVGGTIGAISGAIKGATTAFKSAGNRTITNKQSTK
jgi:hypothetical protein